MIRVNRDAIKEPKESIALLLFPAAAPDGHQGFVQSPGIRTRATLQIRT
jgi:hypothetical protein